MVDGQVAGQECWPSVVIDCMYWDVGMWCVGEAGVDQLPGRQAAFR